MLSRIGAIRHYPLRCHETQVSLLVQQREIDQLVTHSQVKEIVSKLKEKLDLAAVKEVEEKINTCITKSLGRKVPLWIVDVFADEEELMIS